MKCEEYREAITADPSESFEGGAAHAATCAPCTAFRDELRRVNERIARALAIDVPDLRLPELPEWPGDMSSNVTILPDRRSPRSKLPAWLGLAAVLAAA